MLIPKLQQYCHQYQQLNHYQTIYPVCHNNNQKIFTSFSFGLDAAIVQTITTSKTRNIHKVAYLCPLIKQLFCFKNKKQSVQLDGVDIGQYDLGIVTSSYFHGHPIFKLNTACKKNTWQIYLIKDSDYNGINFFETIFTNFLINFFNLSLDFSMVFV